MNEWMNVIVWFAHRCPTAGEHLPNGPYKQHCAHKYHPWQKYNGELYECTVGILIFSFLKLLCFYLQESHPLHRSMILTWEARNNPHRLTKGFESIENWSGTSRETEGFFLSGQEPLITTHRLLLPGCFLVGLACEGTPTPSGRDGMAPSQLGQPLSRLRHPPSLRHHLPSRQHQTNRPSRQHLGGRGREEALEGAHLQHHWRWGPRCLPYILHRSQHVCFQDKFWMQVVKSWIQDAGQSTPFVHKSEYGLFYIPLIRISNMVANVSQQKTSFNIVFQWSTLNLPVKFAQYL